MAIYQLGKLQSIHNKPKMAKNDLKNGIKNTITTYDIVMVLTTTTYVRSPIWLKQADSFLMSTGRQSQSNMVSTYSYTFTAKVFYFITTFTYVWFLIKSRRFVRAPQNQRIFREVVQLFSSISYSPMYFTIVLQVSTVPAITHLLVFVLSQLCNAHTAKTIESKLNS